MLCVHELAAILFEVRVTLQKATSDPAGYLLYLEKSLDMKEEKYPKGKRWKREEGINS